MGAQRESLRFGPTFHGPRLKWYTPWGVILLVAWGAGRYFVTGRPLYGKSDNATFLRDATVDYRGGPVEKLTRARWRRVAWRWALLGVPLLLLALAGISAVAGMLTQAWWAHIPWGTVLGAYAIVGTCAGIAYAGHLIAAWWPQRTYRKTYIYPAGRVLARVTGTRYHRREALTSIALPAGFGEDAVEEPVRVYVPDVALDEKAKRRIADAVGARLGLPSPRAQWTEAGVERAYVDLLPQPLPPASIALADLMDELLASPLDEPVVGVAPGGRVIRMDFRNDSPHTLGSAGSGAGKSTLYKFVAMQRLHHGAYAIILDFKKWSHLRWAGRLPSGRVLIEDEVPRIHEVLCRVLDELLWRKSFDLHQEAELEGLPTIDVYVEEINTLMSLLVEWWKAEAARRKQEARTAVRLAKEAEDEFALGEAEEMLAQAMGLPTVSPAVQALRYGVNLGREFHIHFHFIGQSMSAKAAGGRDTRESFRTRLLARWDAKTWKMLADGVPFIACPSASVGVWAHVHGSEVDIVRVPYVADADAVAYVHGGTRPSLPMFHGDAPPAVEVRAAVPAALPLSDLVAALPAKANGGRVTLEALRKAAQREGFPQAIEGTGGAGRAALYPVDEVLAWHRDRERLAVEA